MRKSFAAVSGIAFSLDSHREMVRALTPRLEPTSVMVSPKDSRASRNSCPLIDRFSLVMLAEHTRRTAFRNDDRHDGAADDILARERCENRMTRHSLALMRATKSAKVSYVQIIAKVIEDSEGEKEVILKREDLIGFVTEMGTKAEAGAAYADALAAVRNSQIHPKFLAVLTDIWTNVVNRPRVVPMSHLGLEQLARQSLAAAKALIPMTRSIPDDSILEVTMMALLLRIKDVCR